MQKCRTNEPSDYRSDPEQTRVCPVVWTNSNPLHPRMIFVKFQWCWRRKYYDKQGHSPIKAPFILLRWKRSWSVIATNLNHLRMLLKSLQRFWRGWQCFLFSEFEARHRIVLRCFLPSLVESGIHVASSQAKPTNSLTPSWVKVNRTL